MTNEAVCIETPTRFERRTIAAGAAIPFGTLMKLTTPNTVVITSADNDPFGGICWTPSLSTDSFTEITVAMNGKWDILTDAGNDTEGTIMSITGANQIGTAIEADIIAGATVGKLDEAATNALVARVSVGVMI